MSLTHDICDQDFDAVGKKIQVACELLEIRIEDHEQRYKNDKPEDELRAKIGRLKDLASVFIERSGVIGVEDLNGLLQEDEIQLALRIAFFETSTVRNKLLNEAIPSSRVSTLDKAAKTALSERLILLYGVEAALILLLIQKEVRTDF